MSVCYMDRVKITSKNTGSAYGANDVFGPPFSNILSPDLGSNLYIDRVEAILQQTAAIDLQILIFQRALTTLPVDNNALNIDEAEYRALYVTSIEIAAADFLQVSGSDIFRVSKILPAFKIIGGRQYYLVLKTGTAFTPGTPANLDLYFYPVEVSYERT